MLFGLRSINPGHWVSRCLVRCTVVLVASCSPDIKSALADYAIYRLPGTTLEVPLEGKATFNAGGTITLRHPRGTLYFSRDQLKVTRTATRQAVLGQFKAKASQDAAGKIASAKQALKLGLLTECKSLLSAAWKLEPKNPKIAKLATLMMYINRPVPNNPAEEQKAREWVHATDEMVSSRSKHFLLIHDTPKDKDPITKKTRAEMRLELLETVYESYFLSFALNGFYMRPPKDPLIVFLYNDHKKYLLLERQIGEFVKQAAGFFSPISNVAVFYDSGTTDSFRALSSLTDQLNLAKEKARRERSPNAKDVIRFANTVTLLVDIQRETEDVAVVSHEATHQLAANTGLFPKDGVFVRWVHEGLASFYESSKMARWSGIGAVDEDRISYYRALEGDSVRGGIDFIVSDLGFLIEANLRDQASAYGQAWALTHFLYNERFDQLIKFYGQIRTIPKGTKPREKGKELLRLFDESFGDRTRLEFEWRRYMRSLKTDLELIAGGIR